VTRALNSVPALWATNCRVNCSRAIYPALLPGQIAYPLRTASLLSGLLFARNGLFLGIVSLQSQGTAFTRARITERSAEFIPVTDRLHLFLPYDRLRFRKRLRRGNRYFILRNALCLVPFFKGKNASPLGNDSTAGCEGLYGSAMVKTGPRSITTRSY